MVEVKEQGTELVIVVVTVFEGWRRLWVWGEVECESGEG